MSLHSALADECVDCPGGGGGGGGSSRPTATRNDGHYPNYEYGDQAVLTVKAPGHAFEDVYTWRKKDGSQERSALVIGQTDSNGTFINTVTITDTSVCGSYSDEKFAVGSSSAPKSVALSYTVTGCP